MSAGGLSYSGLTNYGVATLPSVDSWGTNMNILRDPPRSITTRKVDKVGETSSITQMIDDSGNRACEAINVFARGVNPSVSVSYSNHGNNGGQGQAGHLTGLNAPMVTQGRSAKLPYTIIKDGAFRPPVLTQEDLLPLSRLPRVWTSAFSQPGFADFSRKMRTCGSAADTKEVRTDTLKACVRPTATYKIETPISEPFEVKYVIQPTIKTSVTSGLRAMDITEQVVKKPTKEIDNAPLHAHATANIGDKSRYINNSKFETDRYVQDTNAHHVDTNISSNMYHTKIEDIADLADLPVQDIRTLSHTAPVSRGEKTDYIHDDIELKRKVPEHRAATNFGDKTIYRAQKYENEIQLERNMPGGSFESNPIGRGSNDHTSRVARLNPKIQAGSYHVPGQVPMRGRMQDAAPMAESEKARMSRMVMESMQGRFEKPAPFG